MPRQSWVTMWEQWRDLMGAPSSAVRREINKLLETRPCMLYWGDSWFSTPLYLNLARQSMRRTDGLGILIGKPGAQAERLFTRSEVNDKVSRLRKWPFDIVCLSAGGNDALSDRLAQMSSRNSCEPGPYSLVRGPRLFASSPCYDGGHIDRDAHARECHPRIR